jgi:hypothetical protein
LKVTWSPNWREITIFLFRRENYEDKSVNVRILDDYFGAELDESLILEFSDSKKKSVREQALTIVKTIYEREVFLPDIEGWNFIVGEGDVPGMILTGLEASYDPKAHGETSQDMEVSARNAIRCVEGMLEELGLYEEL